MKLPKILYEQIKRHALREAPRECCGVIAADASGKVVRVYEASNVSPEPRYNYRMDPDAQFFIEREVQLNGWHIVGVYHSHTFSEPRPSLADISHAYPGVLHLIVSLREGLVTMAWNLEGIVRQVPLEIV